MVSKSDEIVQESVCRMCRQIQAGMEDDCILIEIDAPEWLLGEVKQLAAREIALVILTRSTKWN